jgi:hypothetical protein
MARAAQALDLLQSQAGAIGHLPGGRGKRFPQQPVQETCLPNFHGPCTRHSRDQAPQVACKWLMQRQHRSGAHLQTDAFCFQQCRIHAIDAGT